MNILGAVEGFQGRHAVSLEHTHSLAEDQPLDKEAAQKALAELAEEVNAGQPGQPKKSLDEVLLFLC